VKIAVIGDLHFGVDSKELVFDKNLNKVLNEFVFPYLLENNIKTIVQLGDINEKRQNLNVLSGEIMMDSWFKPIIENNFELWQILGNHDCYYNNTTSSSILNVILKDDYLSKKLHSNIHLVKKTETVGDDLGFMSWGEKEIPNSKYLFGHFDIIGFEIQNGIVCKKGFNISDFFKQKFVFSGHFHRKSIKGNIIYTGSLTANNFGDYDSEHGFYILDTDDGKFEFISHSYNLFAKIIYSEKIDIENFQFDLYKNKIVKLVVPNLKDELKYDKFINILKEYVFDLKTTTLDIGVSPDIKLDDSIDISDTFTLMKNYIESIELPNDKNQSTLLEIMENIYIEAASIEE